MSWAEAELDGIQKGKGIYKNQYVIPCEICGSDVIRTQYSRKRNYICDYCKGSIKKKEKIALEHIGGVGTPAEKRFSKAVASVKKQAKNFKEYEKAITLAKTRTEKYGSVPEAMVVIELLKNKHRIIPQQKVGKYKVDFALPDIKMVIEVDGEVFHRNNRNDEREATIQLSLGLDWKIVHIPAELIAEDIIKLEEAINISR